jgi:methionyl-tRNA synthetase
LGTHTALLYDPAKARGEWKPSDLQPGARFNQPSPLFKKLDEKIVEEERQNLGE